MTEETKEIKEIEMYSYFIDGKELWTSNIVFAQIRASQYGSGKVYVKKVLLEE